MVNVKALLAWDSMALLLICIADMLSTLYWVHQGVATEANPYMAYWLRQGDAQFCMAKILSFVPLLLVAAYYRERRPRLVAVTLRGSIFLYMLIYVTAVGSQIVSHFSIG